MLAPIEELPDSARIWIYQADRRLSDKEAGFAKAVSGQFLSQWQAHGQDLRAAFELRHQQFLILAVDEGHAQATGCSIDASVHVIQQIERELTVSFSTNGLVAFLVGEEIRLKPFNKIKEAVGTAEIEPGTPVFDNTVQSLGDYRSRWNVASEATWLKRYF